MVAEFVALTYSWFVRMLLIGVLVEAVACGHRVPEGTPIATISGSPTKILAIDDNLVIEAHSDEDFTEMGNKGARMDILAVPMAGGDLRTIGALLQGPMVVDGGVVYYATELGGELYELKPNGAPQRFGRHFKGTINGLATVDGALIVVQGNSTRVENDWTRVDLKTGNISSVTEPMSSSSTLISANRRDTAFLVSELRGTTFEVAHDGKISVEIGPPGWISCVAVTDKNIWWFRHSLESVPQLYTAPIAGGPPVWVPEQRPAGEAIVACTANARELVYTKGKTIVARTADGKVTEIASMHGFPGKGMFASDTRVYWGEQVSDSDPHSKWTILSAPLP